MGVGKGCGFFSCCTWAICCVLSPICYCCAGLLMFMLLAAIIAVLSLYFLFLPKVPELQFLSHNLQEYNATFIPGGETVLQGDVAFMLSIKNPNKMNLELDESATSLNYLTLLLSNQSIPALKVPGKSSENRSLDMTFQARIPETYSGSFSSDYRNGTFLLKLYIAIKGRINFVITKSPATKVILDCDVELEIYSRNVTKVECSTKKKYST